MTIKERAENYVKDWSPRDWEFARSAMSGYVKGATEQKAIDIDKACGWLLSQGIISSRIADDMVFIKRFRKAMEDKQ